MSGVTRTQGLHWALSTALWASLSNASLAAAEPPQPAVQTTARQIPVAPQTGIRTTSTQPSEAPTTPIDYAIEAQPLSSALLQYAHQSEFQILFRVRSLPNVTAGPLKGRFSATQAIKQLLNGTALTYTLGANKTIVIRPLPSTAEQTQSGTSRGEYENLPVQPATRSLEELLVTGIRGSLLKNLAVKRAGESVVDVITSEDIGKFPDKNIADSLQRIPGISVDRVWGEGRDINIRGTDKDVNRTLLNGQNVASAYWWANDNPSRGFNYSIFASELVDTLEVHKSPQADIDEGSIGGTVILRTRRPLDLPAGTFHLALEEQFSQLPETWDPQASSLFSWKNKAQNLGLLASVNYQNRTLRRDGLEAFPDNNRYTIIEPNGTTTPNVHVPWGMGSAIFQQERERLTSNLSLQWRANTEWSALFNAVISDMDMDNSNQNFLSVPGGSLLSAASPTLVHNPTIGIASSGVATLLGGTVENNTAPGAVLDAIFRKSFIKSSVYDLAINYTGQAWQFDAQLGKTQAKGGGDRITLYRFEGLTREHFALSPRTIEFSFLDISPLDARDLPNFSSQSHEWSRTMKDEESYAQVDLHRHFNSGALKSIKLGIKWRDHNIENRRREGSINTAHPLWQDAAQIGLEQTSSSLTPYLHDETGTGGSLHQYAWVNERLAEQVFRPLLEAGLMNYQEGRAAFFEINEKIKAAYFKTLFEMGPWRGNFGVRMVNTRQTSSAYQTTDLVDYSRDYDDFLPSLNIVYQLNEDLLLRGSLASIMARPTFPNLTPSVIIDATDGSASGGNPDLKPFRAKQLDAGFEWYFADRSIVSAMYFYKEISTFVYTQRQLELLDNVPTQVTRPQNAPGADIQGIELQWQQDIGGGFGLIANYTYTDAKVPSHPGVDSLNLPGNSKDQLNTSLYYEQGAVSARLSYNFRSNSFGGFAGGSQNITEAYEQWDASANWAVNKHFSLSLQAVNLLNETVHFRTAEGLPQGLYENGSRYVIGFRYHY